MTTTDPAGGPASPPAGAPPSAPPTSSPLPPPPAPPGPGPGSPWVVPPAAPGQPTDRTPPGDDGPGERRGREIGAWFNRLVRGDRPRPADSVREDDGPASGPATAGASRPAAAVPPGQAAAGAPAPPGGAPGAPPAPASRDGAAAARGPAPPLPALSAEAEAALAALGRVGAEELARLADPSSGTVLSRAAQAEADRRAHLAQRRQSRDQRAQRVEALAQQAQATRAQARQARQVDAYRGGELDEQADQIEDQVQAVRDQERFVHGLVGVYDGATLDPLVQALPEPARAAVLATPGPDADALEGRRQVVTAALEALERHWRADEQQRLRGNATFRRQVLAEARAPRGGAPLRGGARAADGVRPAAPVPVGADDGEDDLGPELLPGRGASAPARSMDSWMRQRLR